MNKDKTNLQIIGIVAIVAIVSLVIIAIYTFSNGDLVGFAPGGKATKTQCNDNIDNDGDGYCDYIGCFLGKGKNKQWLELDPQCDNEQDNNEAQEVFCGNGIVELNEECDDGNSINDDSCRNDCALPHCGDLICDNIETYSSCPQDYQPEYDYTKGSYAMWEPTAPIPAEIINNPGVVGILAGASWREIEIEDGVYDWLKIDTKISEAEQAGLKIVLKIVTSPAQAPDWLKNNPNVQKISVIDTNQYHSTYCQNLTVPVFWDPIFHEKKKQLIREAGELYYNNPTVVAVMASFANMYTDDWHIPHVVGYVTDCGIYLNQVNDWLDAGYTTEKMFNLGKEIIDTTAEAFPNQALKLPIAPTHKNLDNTSTKLAELVLDYAYSKYPERFYAQMNGLSTSIPYADDPLIDSSTEGGLHIRKLLKDHSPQIGLQMLAGASNGDTDGCRQNGKSAPCPPYEVLNESVNIGLSYNPHFIEYWRVDSANEELYDIFIYATDNMK